VDVRVVDVRVVDVRGSRTHVLQKECLFL